MPPVTWKTNDQTKFVTGRQGEYKCASKKKNIEQLDKTEQLNRTLLMTANWSTQPQTSIYISSHYRSGLRVEATVGDDAMEEIVTSGMERVKESRDGAGAVTNDRHSIRITVEQMDVVLNPLQRRLARR